MDSIKIATRGSRLALLQTALVAGRLREMAITDSRPNIEIMTHQTIGDQHRKDWDEIKASLNAQQKSRKWTDRIEQMVVDRVVDLAVHSAKDLPWQTTDDTEFIPVLEREDPRDVFISSSGNPLEQMPYGFSVGTNSLRRRALISSLRPDVQFCSYSGNVNTRINPDQMARAKVHGIVMAAAGLKRLGILPSTAEFLSPISFVPAPNQGTLVAQFRKDAPDDLRALLRKLVDPKTERTWSAERGVRETLKADCESPLSAFAWTIPSDGPSREKLVLRARIMSRSGRAAIEVSDEATDIESPHRLGERVAELLLGLGAQKLWDADKDRT